MSDAPQFTVRAALEAMQAKLAEARQGVEFWKDHACDGIDDMVSAADLDYDISEAADLIEESPEEGAGDAAAVLRKLQEKLEDLRDQLSTAKLTIENIAEEMGEVGSDMEDALFMLPEDEGGDNEED